GAPAQPAVAPVAGSPPGPAAAPGPGSQPAAVVAPAPAATGQAPPPAGPALPSATPLRRGSSPAADALQVVKSLRSARLGGLSFREYQTRVNAAANIVNRYLAALPDGPESESISDAVRYFTLAESAWNNQGTTSRTVWLKRADALDRCSVYQDYAKSM